MSNVPRKTVKGLFNSIDYAVEETLSGFCHLYPQLEVDTTNKIIFTPDLKDRKSKVSIICGGGSGHEPFAAGFVGRGMLTASIAGSIFAAPPSVQISHAIETVAAYSNAGILVVIPNYTGDCLNFGIGIEKARQLGIRIADVIVGEDCSIPEEEQGIAGKRGLTGLLFVIKIIGALAERGAPLQEVEQLARNVLQNIATYAVGLSACGIPGRGLMFELAADEIECGMGIHGEAGYERMKLLTAKEVVAFILKRICNCLNLTDGDSVAVIVNNFGALSQLEQGIVVHEVVGQLGNMNIKPMRVYSGVLMTSLNSSGIHVTLLRLHESYKCTFISCLDDATLAPRWPGCAYSIPMSKRSSLQIKDIRRTVNKVGVEINVQGQKLMECCLKNACEAIIEKEEVLNDLDKGCGDGDCGSTLRLLADGVLQNLSSFYLSHPSSVLSELANIAEYKMGGTTGALYSLFFTTIGKELANVQENENWPAVWARVFRSGLNCLMKYGKARLGDRTMIDSMEAACQTFEKSLKSASKEIYPKVAEAAWNACEATKSMKPRAGRASYVKQKQYLQSVDAGAFAIATWIAAVVHSIITFQEEVSV